MVSHLIYDHVVWKMNSHSQTPLARNLILASLLVWSTIFCRAQDNSAFIVYSPKLKQFLADHPVASASLTHARSEAFSNRKLVFYYFYSDDESTARAAHYYPNPTSVTVIVRENQLPCDECISILFEILNSEGEPRFQQLMAMAKAGSISRTGYATEVLKQEFIAEEKARDLILKFGLSQKEISESYFYNRLVQCPDNFEDSLSYRRKVSPNRGDPLKDYEQYYDSLRQYYDSLTKKPDAGTNSSKP